MRAVIDTNVLMAALLWRGPPHALLEHVRAGTVSLVSSPALLAELADVIRRTKFDAILTRTNTSRERSLAEVRRLAEVIVSGDGNLLSLGSFARIPLHFVTRVLQVFGGSERLNMLLDSRADVTGLSLMDERLPKRVRARKPGTVPGAL